MITANSVRLSHIRRAQDLLLDDFQKGPGDEVQSRALVDLGESEAGMLPCAAQCYYFTITTYYCSLLSKFLTDTDVDECQEKSDNCHLHASCKNTAGSFECFCHDGFTGNGRLCAGTEIPLSQGPHGPLSEAYPNVLCCCSISIYITSRIILAF